MIVAALTAGFLSAYAAAGLLGVLLLGAHVSLAVVLALILLASILGMVYSLFAVIEEEDKGHG